MEMETETTGEVTAVRTEDLQTQPINFEVNEFASHSSNDVPRNVCTPVTTSTSYHETGEANGFPQRSDDSFRCGDSLIEFSDLDQDYQESKEDQETESANAQQRAVWEVIQPSEYNLNKLDGWSLKVNASPKFDIPDVESLPVEIESWLKENVSDTYYSSRESQDSTTTTGRRKSKVRWADVESRLQSLMLDPSMESSFSAGTLSS